jgi:hypothetical protein
LAATQPLGVILLRMAQFASATCSFAERLAQESGYRVACLVDERAGLVEVAPFPKVSLTVEACCALDLYCPPDMGWRCGDYGLYLARAQFPDAPHFWLIDYDVRISGPDLGAFFKFFETNGPADLIAPQYGPAGAEWYWRHTIRARNVTVYRCLFPLVRVTASAVDRLLARRRRMSRSWIRRISWPNDESTVATTLSNDGSICRDLNGFGRTVYTDETFSFFTPFDGDALDMSGSDAIAYHPVLFAEDYRRKLAKLQVQETRLERFRRRLANRLNALSAW